MLDFQDLDVFFDTQDGIAQDVLVGAEGDEVTIPAILRRSYQALGENVSSSLTNLLIRDSDVDALAIEQGTRVVVETVAYSVYDVQLDGPGVSRVFLNKMRRS